uniref:Putative ovule protein n=1 Tax=Solanum chacoense TaxID=4108 RepID=A0A0V0GJE1_SOLCH
MTLKANGMILINQHSSEQGKIFQKSMWKNFLIWVTLRFDLRISICFDTMLKSVTMSSKSLSLRC